MKPPELPDPPAAGPGTERLTRLVRIGVMALVVLGLEWRLVDPRQIVAAPHLAAMPWAILSLLTPVAIGVWTFEVATRGGSGLKADLLWGVLIASLIYVALLFAMR